MRTAACMSANVLALFILAGACPAIAQPEMSKSTGDGVPIMRLVERVAEKSGKKFIVDPRVRADVQLVGQQAADVSYDEFLVILSIYGFTALEGGGYVRVIPDAIVRQLPLPMVSSSSKHSANEFVTAVIPVKNMPATQLVPILRPLLPQAGHLAAVLCSNTLIMVDTYGNVKRIEALVQEIDTGTPYKLEKCPGYEKTTASMLDAAFREAIREAVSKEMSKDTAPRDRPPSR